MVEGQTYTVVVDGVEYTLECQHFGIDCVLGEIDGEGEPDFTNYPFLIIQESPYVLPFLTILDVGNHTVEIIQTGKEVTTTDDFDAVRGYSSSKNITEIINDHATVQSGSSPNIQHINPLEEGKTYTVVINNETYQRQLTGPVEGAMVLAQYPDHIINGWLIGAPQDGVSSYFFISPQDGSFDIHVYEEAIITHTTPEFDMAVQSVIEGNAPLMVYGGFVDDYPVFMNDVYHEYTYQQLADIIDSGRVVYLRLNDSFVNHVARGYEISYGESFNNVVPIIHENNAVKVRFAFYGTIADNLVICVIDMYQSTNEPHATTAIHKSNDHGE